VQITGNKKAVMCALTLFCKLVKYVRLAFCRNCYFSVYSCFVVTVLKGNNWMHQRRLETEGDTSD